jgi:hypothetical protein
VGRHGNFVVDRRSVANNPLRAMQPKLLLIERRRYAPQRDNSAIHLDLQPRESPRFGCELPLDAMGQSVVGRVALKVAGR